MDSKISYSVRKLRDFYEQKPNAPLVMREFGFYSLERWKSEGHINDGTNLTELFGFDEYANCDIFELGWCEAPFYPLFEEKVLEDRGEWEVVRDIAGRAVLYFKNRRSGFMPEYLDHPVKDLKTWENDIKWRLDPDTPQRYENLENLVSKVNEARNQGKIITERIIGGYMYLRSLIGPEKLLYAFYDDPELIHECMKTWLKLCDKVLSVHQSRFDIDEIFLAEDICYNVSSLISHDMIREFLFPYYRELIEGVKSRQKGSQKLYIQIDTDGNAVSVIDLYKEIGMNYMSPFEVASGCDVVKVREKYPDLLISGGFDKRILAQGKKEIDKEIDRIIPYMIKYGGYIPTCDHGVPAEVSFENYMHFRKRLSEFA